MLKDATKIYLKVLFLLNMWSLCVWGGLCAGDYRCPQKPEE